MRTRVGLIVTFMLSPCIGGTVEVLRRETKHPPGEFNSSMNKSQRRTARADGFGLVCWGMGVVSFAAG